MTRGRVLKALAVAALVALLWSRQTYEPLSYYSSRNYVQRANELIRKGGLKYDCPTNKIILTPRASAAEQKWFEASYLRNDVELYNRNRELFGHFFVVQDCDLREINPYLRTIRLPFAKSVEWLGNIEYSGPGADATLISSNGRTIAVQRSVTGAPQEEKRTRVGATNDLTAHLVHFDFAGGSATPAIEVHSVAGTAVLEQRVKRGQPAEVRLLGNAVSEGRIARMVSGDWLHLSSSAPASRSETFLFTGERRYERLSSVRLRNAKQERTYTEDEPLLRWIGGEDGEEMLTFGEALARSVTNALQQLSESRAKQLATQFDVQLSIDRSLQADLDELLGTHAAALVRDAAGGDPFGASVTVMNGRTGEILAAASFPSHDYLENLRGVTEDERRRLLVNHNFKRHPIGSAGKPFIYAGVGSRHPFLLDLTVEPHGPVERPDGGKGERELLHFFMPRDYRLWPHTDERIGLESAIERSCNKFTVELATMALAAPEHLRDRTLTQPLADVFARQPDVAWPRAGARGGVQIGAEELTFPPSLRGFMLEIGKAVPAKETTTAAVYPGSLNRIDEVPFIEAFEAITGVRTYGGVAAPEVPVDEGSNVGRTAMVTMQYDLRPWRPLVERFTEGESEEKRWKLRAAFQSVSPERVNLSLNQVTDLRTEFVSLLLGGSTSLWTNVQLAEGLSRLVTRRQVEASMLHAIRERAEKDPPEPPPPVFPPLEELSDEARTRVLRGMTRVALGTRGTANRALGSWVTALQQRFPGYKTALFSKTGSPTVTRPESKPISEILPQLVTSGALRYANNHLAVSPDGTRVVPYAAPTAPNRAAYIDALTAATRTASRRAGQRFSLAMVRRIAAFTDRFERYRSRLTFPSPDAVRLTEATSLPFHVVNESVVINREHPIYDPATQTDSSAVYIVALVKWKGEGDVPTPQELEQPDAKIITVAFYYDIGPGSEIAVEAARTMLPRIAKLLE